MLSTVLFLIWSGFHVQCLHFVVVPQNLILFVYFVPIPLTLSSDTLFSESLIDFLHVSLLADSFFRVYDFYKLTFGFFNEPTLHPLHYLCIW